MRVRWVGSVVAALVIGLAGCGRAATEGSASGRTTSTVAAESSTSIAETSDTTPSAPCLKAHRTLYEEGRTFMRSWLTMTDQQSEAHVKPLVAATLKACRTPADWDAAANVVVPPVGGSLAPVDREASADQTRAGFCEQFGDERYPACS
jgi:hypothetical protein